MEYSVEDVFETKAAPAYATCDIEQELLTDALDTAGNPAAHCNNPNIFIWSWSVLKSARGHRINFHKLDEPAHRIEPPSRITDRIRRHIAATGLPARPPALIAQGAIA
ncbi:hypothetical protein [Phaeobacter inhibens]|uniref:hypothetical protein n=1 Tax=Phaeobacter inhibens TaxID=221822 RepID=UPI0021A7941B|nr:hypothetical protein [Phaeobacter inhibens]UWR57206.1 hypothetical protein K4F89_01760 [Phaeobacter inhibens]